MTNNTEAPPRLLSRKQLLERVPLSFGTIWAKMRAGQFPRSYDIGGKSAWLESEVESWIRSRPLRALKGDAPVDMTTTQPKQLKKSKKQRS